MRFLKHKSILCLPLSVVFILAVFLSHPIQAMADVGGETTATQGVPPAGGDTNGTGHGAAIGATTQYDKKADGKSGEDENVTAAINSGYSGNVPTD